MIIDVLTHKIGALRYLTIGLLLVGCASQDPIELDSQQHLEAIEKDWSGLYPDLQPASGGAMSLSVKQAVGRALQHNLDARVAALEALIAQDNISLAQFEGAPNITASTTATRRSNQAASSSESILTGTESLEPSASSEQARQLADIKAQWNILDSVIAYLEGKNAEDQSVTAKERLRKVQQNIERDVINAYWQAYAGEGLEDSIDDLSVNIRGLQKSIDSAVDEKILTVSDASDRISRLVNQQAQMSDLMKVVRLSKSELKAISALPMDMDLKLTTNPKSFKGVLEKTLKNKTQNKLIKLALQNRPELRESYMSTNVSVRGVERELLKTFPGLNLIYSRSYDSNRFLNESTWTDLTGAITQSISDFISLPTRYNAAKNREELEKNRRKALTAAIIAQVHIAQIRIDLARDDYSLALSNYKISKNQVHDIVTRNKMGVASGYDSVLAQSQILSKEIERNQAFAELQKAYIDMIGTLGLSLDDIQNGMGVS